MMVDDDTQTFPVEETSAPADGEPYRIQVAALPWREGPEGVEVMLITSRDTRRWVLPKGWPEKNESLSDAALREAGEEAGLRGAMSEREAGRYVYAKVTRRGAELPCEVIVFPLKVRKVASKWKERRMRERKWMSAREAAQSVREPDLGDLIAAFGADPERFIA